MFFHQTHNSDNSNNYNAFFYDDVHWPAHFHKHYELVYVLSGAVTCTIWDRTELLPAGSFALFLSGEVHALSSMEHSRCWIGVFSGEFVHAFTLQVEGCYGSVSRFCCCESIHNYLLKNLIHENQPERLILKSCLYAALSEYLHQTKLVPQSGQGFQLLNKIYNYVEENYKESVTLQDISRTLGYNYSYLSRYFARNFNMPFKSFLNSYRLEQAKQMLLETDEPVINIALETGFQSLRNFNHFFQRTLNTTPTEFRHKAKNTVTQRKKI